jgi:triacylglycerol lipase
MNLLLVHGFLNRGSFLRPLQRRLEAAGHACFAPSLRPCDARHGIPDLANKLADYTDGNLPANAPLAIVGFSMGCVVAEYYLQSKRKLPRVRAFFAISGPMNGTLTAWLYPGQGTRQMRPGSRFLQQLAAAGNHPADVPIFTYFTPLDLMIIPTRSSRIANARELSVWSPLHHAMLYNQKVAADILEILRELGMASTTGGDRL